MELHHIAGIAAALATPLVERGAPALWRAVKLGYAAARKARLEHEERHRNHERLLNHHHRRLLELEKKP